MAQKKKPSVQEKVVAINTKNNPQGLQKKSHFNIPAFSELKIFILFLIFCILTLVVIDFAPAPTEAFRNLLGQAPPLQWMNIAFAVYFSTELILILCRKRPVDTDRHAWKQILFMAAFCFFYWSAGALQQHFALLVCYGIILQLLEASIRANTRRSEKY